MHYNFAVKWLKAFRSSSEEVCALYADDFIFEDVMLDQHNINNKPDLLRLFTLYANKDRENGMGVHNFRIRGYIGDERSGLITWEWNPEDCANFIGIDVAGKPFMTMGHTYHQYDEQGFITRESSWWDAACILRQTHEIKPDRIPTARQQAAVPA